MSALMHSWGETLSRALARAPQFAADLGLGAWPIAALVLAAGLALLLAGVRLGPLLSGAAGAAVGWLAATHFPSIGASWGIPPATEAWAVTAVTGLACAFAPALYPILLGVVPGVAWGHEIPLLGHGWLGAAAAALVLGAIAYVARRIVLAATAAVAGALLVDAALVVLAARFPVLTGLTTRPTLLAATTAVLIVAGTATQISSQGSGGARARGGRGRDKHAGRLRDDD